jgi:DNA replication and repair protein RecF
MKYRRARKQRNEVLRQYKNRPEEPPASMLKPWTEELVTLGSRVIRARHAFLQTFREYLRDAYEQIEAVAERPTIDYETIGDLDPLRTEDGELSTEAVAELFRSELDRKSGHEQQRGTTLVGPQRDELVFRLDDLEVRRYGSQGQHRTFAMALKLAQYFYLRDRGDHEPLLLLDDAFGKLDARRTRVFLDLLESNAVGQSIITATQREAFDQAVDFDRSDHRVLRVDRADGAARVRSDTVADAPATGEPSRDPPVDAVGASASDGAAAQSTTADPVDSSGTAEAEETG